MTDWIGHFRGGVGKGRVARLAWLWIGAVHRVRRADSADGASEGRRASAATGEIELMIEWSWRIEDERSIVCGSWSDEKLWQPAFDGLIGRKVIDLTTFGHLPELSVSLAGCVHVASFMTSEGDPAWTLFDRRDPRLITVTCRSGVIQEVDGGP